MRASSREASVSVYRRSPASGQGEDIGDELPGRGP